LRKELRKTVEKVIDDRIEEERVLEEREASRKRRSQKQKNKPKNKNGGNREKMEPKEPSQKADAKRKRLQGSKEKAEREDTRESKVGHPFALSPEQEANLMNKVKEDISHNILHPLKWMCERVLFLASVAFKLLKKAVVILKAD
jgi:hypothetical protein